MGEKLIAIDTSQVRKPRPVEASRWAFPHPQTANPLGLVAQGGDFAPGTLVAAYRQGIFPWPHGEEDYLWFSPGVRAIIPAGGLHVSRRLRRRLRQGVFRASIDHAFGAVLDGCSDREEGTWITPAYRAAYERLHELGHAHSFEVWTQDGRLAGGLYGLATGGVFAGESMFHSVTDGSKAAMVAMMQHIEGQGFAFADVQMPTDHLLRMGARQVRRDDYLEALAEAVSRDVWL